jgi:hypothetical protein
LSVDSTQKSKMENQKSNKVKAKEKRKRGLWSPEEDTKLYNHIITFGVDSWSSLPRKAGNLSLSLYLSISLSLSLSLPLSLSVLAASFFLSFSFSLKKQSCLLSNKEKNRAVFLSLFLRDGQPVKGSLSLCSASIIEKLLAIYSPLVALIQY